MFTKNSLLFLFLLIIITFFLILNKTILMMTTQPSSQPGFFPFYNSRYISKTIQDDINAVRYSSTYERTPENIALFKETDIDITQPFKRLLPQASQLQLYVIANNPLLHTTASILKIYYNRPRPYQIDPKNIIPLDSKTRHTPSYPSSHALQSFAIAKHMVKQYPEKADEIMELAENIADVRKIGGVHYPSDKEFARYLANRFPWI